MERPNYEVRRHHHQQPKKTIPFVIFATEKYKDEVLCDVVSMEATHAFGALAI